MEVSLAFDATISLGNILTAVGTVGGILWAYHNWDKRVEIRHIEMSNKVENISQKVDRVEGKIDENTRTTNGVNNKVGELNLKVEKHIVADDIIQKQILTRLDNHK